MKIDLMTAFFHQLKNIALKNKNVFFITADNGAWALADFKKSVGSQYLNIGISEQAMASIAAGMALEGKNSVMPAIVRISNNPYKWEIGCGELKDVANVEKMMPKNYISADGFSITDSCREYLLPLIEGENYSPYNDGLPKYVVLKKSKVVQKLPPFKV